MDRDNMKIIGHRAPCPGGLQLTDNLLRLVIQLRGRKPFHPRGMFRFSSYEEKEAWTRKMLAR